MTRTMHIALATAALALLPQLMQAQGDETSRSAAGGITVKGWLGKVDGKEAAAGMTVDSARFVTMGPGFHVTTGPAITYWNSTDKMSGDYTVKATFSEREFMALNSHPHPYGLVIAGNDMGTGNESYLYCAAYGNGNFIVRGFGPKPFQMNGPRPVANEAVNKAEAKGKPVTQEIAMSVKGNMVSCAINGTVVASYAKSEVLGEGKLKTTDGMYGMRFGHNTDAHIAGLTVTKN